MERSNRCSVSRMVLREKPESVKFMLIVTDPPTVSHTPDHQSVSCEFTEINASVMFSACTSRVGTASRLVKAFDI